MGKNLECYKKFVLYVKTFKFLLHYKYTAKKMFCSFNNTVVGNFMYFRFRETKIKCF